MTPGIIGDLARAAHYAGAVLPFGSLLFLLTVARPACRAAACGTALLGAAVRDARRLAAAGLVLALLASLPWLLSTAAMMSGQALDASLLHGVLGTVLVETQFGRLWTARFALGLLLGLLLWLHERVKPMRAKIVVEDASLLAGAVFLASIALTGHAFAEEGAGRFWHLGADLLHLLAAGAWLGALPALVLLLVRAGKSLPDALPRAAARFSSLGVASVALLVLSGLTNGWFLVGTIPALIGTSYGRVLLVKLGLFLGMLALAAVNRQRLTPRLRPDPNAGARHALSRLRRNAILEIVLGLLILAVVGTLVGMTPAVHEQAQRGRPGSSAPMDAAPHLH